VSTRASGREPTGLRTYVKAVQAHPLILVGLTLIVLAAAFGWIAHKGPRYHSQADVLVTPLQPDGSLSGLQLLQDSSDPTRIIQTAADLLSSDRAAKTAAERIGGISPDLVKRSVQVEPVGQSNIVAVTAEAATPELAAAIADAYVKVALDLRHQRVRTQALAKLAALRREPAADSRSQMQGLQVLADGPDPTMSLAEPATPQRSPIGPPPWLVLTLAAIAGLSLGAIACVLVELTDRRVRDVTELLELFPLPVLARIPRVSRGRLGRGGSPLSLPPAAQEAYRTLQTQVDQPQRRPLVIALVSANAEDGKTSSAVQLAVALADAGRRVVLLDLDLRKPDVARALSLPRGTGMDALVTGRYRLADILVHDKRHRGLAVGSVSPTEGGLVLSPLARWLPTIIEEATHLADYVIVDTAPLGEVSDALPLLPLCDDVIVVARPHNTQRQSLEQVRDLLGRAGITPAGLVLVAVGSLRGRYKAYGAASRKLRWRPSFSFKRAPAGGPSGR
jgi:capsular exopolysaccharide synthesis family protein